MTTHIGRRTLLTALAYNAEHFGDYTFVDDADDNGVTTRSTTYADFWAATGRLAHGLRDMGLAPGDRVAVTMPSCSEYVLTLFALFRAGLVAVPCNPVLTPHELGQQAEHCTAAAAIGSTGSVEHLTTASANVASLRELLLWDIGQASDGEASMNRLLRDRPELNTTAAPADLAALIYTSGTTAQPKGVMLTHGNLYWVAELAFSIYEYHRGDRVLHFFPMHHIGGGVALVAPPILCGGSISIMRKFTASRFSQVLVNSNATLAAINATHVKMILTHPPSADDRAHRLARAQYGLPLDRARFDAFEERFRIRLVEGYGLTEAIGFVTANRMWSMRRFGSVGVPVVGRDVRIVDEDGRDLPAGESGQIVASWHTPHAIMAGYWNDPSATDVALKDGWLHTGDIGQVDDEGYVYYLEREKDIIKRAGVNVAPMEIERVLIEHPAVAEVAVVSAPDEFREEQIVAFVVPAAESPPSAADLEGFCADRLAPYKIPQSFVSLDELPASVLGKIDKKELRRRAAEQGMP